jgi:DNA-binding PadR family transcriptional regulator
MFTRHRHFRKLVMEHRRHNCPMPHSGGMMMWNAHHHYRGADYEDTSAFPEEVAKMLHRGFFDHGPRQERPFQKGFIKFVVLELIRDEPRHGYDLIRAIEERFHGLYTPSPGTIYPTLQMLEEMGHVTCSEAEGRKVYRITEAGTEYLKEHDAAAGQAAERFHRWWNPENVGEMRKLRHDFKDLTQLMMRRGRKVTPDKLEQVREVIKRAHAEIEAILKD